LTTAVYPGSFDPITNGHLDIATRAAAVFDELVIAVFDLPAKTLLFTTEERVELVKKAVVNIPKIRVVSYSGLTINFAKQINAKAIIRGLRMSPDFEREFEMALMNKKLAPDIEVLCMMSSVQYQFLSSSLMKEVALYQGFIEDLVPPHVASALKEKVASTNKD